MQLQRFTMTVTPSFADVDLTLVGANKDQVNASDLNHKIIIRNWHGELLLEIGPPRLKPDEAEERWPLDWEDLLRFSGFSKSEQFYIDLVDMETMKVIRTCQEIEWIGHRQITCVKRHCPRCTLCGKACTSEFLHLLCNHGGIQHLWHPQACEGGAAICGYLNLAPPMYGEVAAKLEVTEERIRWELMHIVARMYGEAGELHFLAMYVLEDILELIQLKVRDILSWSPFSKRWERYYREMVTHDRLAFANPATGKTMWDMWQASTFHDEYVKTKNGYVRYWFVCMAGGYENPCMTAILSKKWQRKFEDLSRPKNKYKCTVCNKYYKRKWGVFVEVNVDGRIYSLRSRIPDEDTLDIKAMDLELKHKDKSTAQALYDAIPMNAPTETQYMRPLDAEKGQYSLRSKEDYRALPTWNWTNMLVFGDMWRKSPSESWGSAG
jgi:hypothetical protein